MSIIAVDDETLVSRIGRGDEDALAALYKRHHVALMSYLALYTSDQGVREEAIQDTMLAVWRGAGRFSGRSTARSWIFSIARKRLMDLLRRKRLPLTGDDALVDALDPAPTPEGMALANASEEEMVMAIRHVAPVHQEVLILTFAYELSYQELADVLGVPLGTIKSRLSNARRALRAQLGTKIS